MIRRLVRAIRRDGVVVATKKCLRQVLHTINPATRRLERQLAKRAEQFDQLHGVDTAGTVYQTSIKSDNPNQLHAVYYRGSDCVHFHEAMSSLDLDYRKYTFIDFGSGKGKALLLASAYPFKKIVGIEFAEELHQVAKNNIARSGKMNIECVCMDATEYTIHGGPLLCYFFNPFDEVVMRKVLANIRYVYETSGSPDIYIVYYNPRCASLFDQEEWLTRLREVGPITIWRTKGAVLDSA